MQKCLDSTDKPRLDSTNAVRHCSLKKNNPRSEQIADKKIDRGIISLCLLKTEELIQHRTLY